MAEDTTITIMKNKHSLIVGLIIAIIRFYQVTISSIFKRIGIKICRFEPTCSNYAILAFNEYGLIGGFKKTVNRLVRCNPFNNGPYVDYPQDGFNKQVSKILKIKVYKNEDH